MAQTYAYGWGSYTNAHSRRATIERLDKLATLLDTALVIPGTSIRFGLDGLPGLIPSIGDTITTLLSVYLVYEAHRLGAPSHVLMRMMANVAFDGVVGAVPLVGDAFDVLWRANRPNMRLLREWAEQDSRP
jgi:hypothetical protein